MIIQPTRGKIASCYLNGVDIVKAVHQIEVFENICKAYKTARIKILIDNPQIEDLVINQGLPGKPIDFSLDSGISRYSDTLYISTKSQSDPTQGGKSQFAILDLIGIEFFKNMNLVAKSYAAGMSATSIASSIHNQFIGTGLSVLMQSLGPLATKTSHIIDSKNPLSAIIGLGGLANYPKYKTGSTMIFKDKTQTILAPLGLLFEGGVTQEFWQTYTAGIHFDDAFGGNRNFNTIMSVVPHPKGEGVPQGHGMNSITGAVKQMTSYYDANKRKYTRKEAFNPNPTKFSGNIQGILSAAKSLTSLATSFEGSQPNYHFFNSENQFTEQNMPWRNTPETILTQAVAQDGICFSLRVPGQSGLNVTVGKKIRANLLNAPGDFKARKSDYGGDALVTEVRHCWNMGDGLKNPCVTDIKVVKGGFR